MLTEVYSDVSDLAHNRSDFCETTYLRSFPDVAYAVARGRFSSGYQHFVEIGREQIRSGRRQNVFGANSKCVDVAFPENFLFDEIGESFFEELYLELNTDVAHAVEKGDVGSGQCHWNQSGWYERLSGMRPMVSFTPPDRPFSVFSGAPDASISNFDETMYKRLFPDLAPLIAPPGSSYQHWLQVGRYEARIGPGLEQPVRRRLNPHALSLRPLGFNIYGPFTTESGLGTAARSIAKAVKSAGFPVDLWCFHVRDGEVWPASHHQNRKSRYSINLMCANADLLCRLFAAYPVGHFDDAYNIAVWQWELASFRPDWFDSFDGLNEVWTNSKFQLDAIQSISPILVRNVPLPVVPSPLSKLDFSEEFGLPTDKYKFLVSFDVGSTLLRKNPYLAIRAFIEHNQRHSNSHLVVKFHGGDNDATTLRELLQKVAGHPCISVISARMNMTDYAKLRTSCDCLLSPHRSEGFGLPIAEFMARGKAVIATNYSGVCDFFDETVGYPVEYDLKELEFSVGPYRKGAVWAEPRLDSLLKQMDHVQSDVNNREHRCRRASNRMRRAFSLDAVGDQIRTIIEELDLCRPLPPYLNAVTSIPDRPLSLVGVVNRSDRKGAPNDFGSILFSFVLPVYNVPGQYLRQCIDSIVNQSYCNWELCICNDASDRDDTLLELDRLRGTSPFIKIVDHPKNMGISAATNTALHMAAGQFVVLVDNDDVVEVEALGCVFEALQGKPDIDVLYTDELKIDESGDVIDHLYKPDWSPEHLESVMYVLHMLVIRKSLLLKVGGFRTEYSGAQDYDLMLRCSRETQNIAHIPLALYKWRAIPGSAAAVVDAKPAALENGFRALKDHVRIKYGAAASVETGLLQGTFRVRRALSSRPAVSLLILTANSRGPLRGRAEVSYVENFVASIYEKTSYRNFEVVIVDDCKLTSEQIALLYKLGARVVDHYSDSARFNFAEKANYAVQQAKFENVVLLNDDMEVIREDWLQSLLELSTDPSIGGVGGRLLHADGSIQHVGMVLGVQGGASHVYHSFPRDFVGYNGLTHIIRNYSCVTAACLATRKSVISAVGGFNTQFAIDYNDVDLCLRILKAGYRIVYTPYAELFHFENSSIRRMLPDPDDIHAFQQSWPHFIDSDPHYNINLSRTACDYSLRA